MDADPGEDFDVQLPAAMAAPASAAGWVDRLVELEAGKARLDAEQCVLLAALDAADSSAKHYVVEEVAAALRLSTSTAQARLKTGRTLAEELPGTLAALDTGRISMRHAQALCAAVWTLPPALARSLEDVALVRASEQTVAELSRTLRRAVLRLDPDGGARRHEQATRERYARRYAGEDGMAELRIFGPAPDIEAAYNHIDAAARAGCPQENTDQPAQAQPTHEQGTHVQSADGPSADGPSADGPSADGRTLEQRRCDVAIAAILAGIGVEQRQPTQQGRPVQVQLTMPLSTLLGEDDEPGELGGHGAIPAALARRLAADPASTWRRLLTDPVSGTLLDHGRRRIGPRRTCGTS